MDERKYNFIVMDKYKLSAEKAKKKGYILNWSNPKRHVDDDLLRFMFKVKMGVDIPMQEYPMPLTIEEFAYCLDKIGLLD